MKKLIILLCLAVFSANIASAQSRVTGTVTFSEDGMPVAYATVTVKGVSGVGVYTDDSGKYTLDNVSSNATLIVSFVGYTTQEVLVNGRSVVNVVLSADASMFEEVMVVAYGTAKKGTFTGSASTVKSAQINDIPQASFENALVGTVSGLQMSPGSGQVGSTVSIRVRGTGSMNASNEPLYVIDGVPVVSGGISWEYSSNNIMNSINPNDIASITVLKDAAASALYGSRAANGVVMITTKSGKQGKMNLNFKANYGFTPTFAYNNLEKASPEDQKTYTIEMYKAWARADPTKYPTEADVEAKALADYNSIIGDDPRGYFDWEKALIKTATNQSYDLSATGGNERSSYFASFGYSFETGRARANDLERWNGRLNVSQKITDFLELTSGVSFSAVEKNGFNDTYNNAANYFHMARNMLYSNWHPTNLDGTPHTEAWRTYAQNTLYHDDYRESVIRTNRLAVNEALKLDILPGLFLKTIFSYDETRADSFGWRAATHPEGVSNGGAVANENYKLLKLVSSTTANWEHTFADKHNVSLLAGWEAEKNKTDYVYAYGSNLPTITAKTVSTAGNKTSAGYFYGNTMLSVLSRLEYNYDDKYYVGASFRRDGSSKLSSIARWGNFWSVSGSWRLHKESFLSSVDWLDNLRLKASYGVNGTLPSGNYGYMSIYAYGTNYNNKPGGRISTTSDDSLEWETNYTYNIGVETAFLNNRITLGIDYYNRDSENLLQDVRISTVTGFSSILTNFGAMNNQGIEIEIGGDIIRKKDLKWNLSINASTLKSRITKLYDKADIIWYDPTGGDNQSKFVYREGFSPKSFYGREWAGVDPDNGNPMWFINKTNPPAADVYSKKIDGRDVTTTWDKAAEVIYGCADPKLFGGINTDLTYKNLSVYMNFTYSLGGEAYNAYERYLNDDGYFTSRTRSVKAMDYWKKPGDITQGPGLHLEVANRFNSYQSRWLYKNNYIRLKNLMVSYNLPKSWVNKAKLSNCRVYFSGANLLTFASQNEFDPEVNVYGVKSWEMPIGRTFTFGLDISL